MNSHLDLFDPAVKQWFVDKVGSPTEVQALSWEKISDGKNVLLTSPTGSGKTLAAFLWSINCFLTGKLPRGKTGVLYISPLKALNNDVRKNLLRPILELEKYFEEQGRSYLPVSIHVRSGDTSPEERRKALKHPPEIFITTPESLNILLSVKNGENLLSSVKTVILDEVHYLTGTKRGVHAITAVDRLVRITGEFQRIAISATVNPITEIAKFLAGYKLFRTGALTTYDEREISIVRSTLEKKYSISIHATYTENDEEDTVWDGIVSEIIKIISLRKSTLVFTNSRRTCEKITRLINEKTGELTAYSHHSSVSKELRLAVEEKMKAGELKAIVATSSLELGIDIGDLEEVALVESPFSVSATIQRSGRAGHSVGDTSVAKIYSSHGTDLARAVVVTKAAIESDIEPVKLIDNPLDVLAQVIVSMASPGKRQIDEIYDEIRSSHPYRDLSRTHFDLIIEMLSGKYSGSRIRELQPRIAVDTIDNTVETLPGAKVVLFMSGGTIPDRGYFNLVHIKDNSRIGELDEEFVWERNPGETFALGAQIWKIIKIDHNSVYVDSASDKLSMVPFWKGDDVKRSFFLSEKIGFFLEEANEKLDSADFMKSLIDKYKLETSAASALSIFLNYQKLSTNSALPNRHHVLLENINDPDNMTGTKEIVLHMCFGLEVNRPFAFALSAAWKRKFGYQPELFAGNDSIMLSLPHNVSAEEIFSLLLPEKIEELLREKLESTGYFGSRFRENAARALLLPKAGFKKRMPLWINRLRSKKILEAVMSYEDFPILIETWRECVNDDFDIPSLKLVLEEIADGKITVSETSTSSPSPFCGDIIWRQTNKYMYEDDTPRGDAASKLKNNYLKEVLFSSKLRPKIEKSIVRSFEEKLQRRIPGYAPETSLDLLELIKSRIVISQSEWEDLCSCINDGFGNNIFLDETPGKIALIKQNDKNKSFIISIENVPLFAHSCGKNMSDFLITGTDGKKETISGTLSKSIEATQKNKLTADIDLLRKVIQQWLTYYGPVSISHVLETFPGNIHAVIEALSTLESEGLIVRDFLTDEATEAEVCDSENLERLLRIRRRNASASIQTLPAVDLQLFLMSWQKINACATYEDFIDAFDHLIGYPAKHSLFEESFFPSRCLSYKKSWLDGLLEESALMFIGLENKSVYFSFEAPDTGQTIIENMLPHKIGTFKTVEIAKHLGLSTEEASKKLWEKFWKGNILNSSFDCVRRYDPSDKRKSNETRRPLARGRFAQNIEKGGWTLSPGNKKFDGSIEEFESSKNKAREVLKRYGIIFRELLSRELPDYQWGKIFKALRIMELSGEIISGKFFNSIGGPQFATPGAVNHFQSFTEKHNSKIFHINACDPSSICGIGIEELKEIFPERRNTTDLYFLGKELCVVSLKRGTELIVKISPDHTTLPEIIKLFIGRLTRDCNPENNIVVKTINGVPANKSPYSTLFRSFKFIENYNFLEIDIFRYRNRL